MSPTTRDLQRKRFLRWLIVPLAVLLCAPLVMYFAMLIAITIATQ